MAGNRPLCVLLVISNLDIGGAQEIVRTLAKYLTVEGCVPVVCTFQDGPLRGEIERLGVPVEILLKRRHSVVAFPLFVLDMLRIHRALLGVVKKYNVNVIQTQLLRGLDFLVLTLRFRRKLVVFWTFHNARFVLREEHLARHRWVLIPKRLAHSLLYRLCARWVNGFIAVSDDVKKSLEEYAGTLRGKVTVILNSVDVKRYQLPVDRVQIRQQLGLDEKAQVMAVVATFKEQKGHCFLIEAASSVVVNFPNLHILFIGDGELRKQLEAQTNALDLKKSIHFLGLRGDIAELLGASDYFVLPSLWEGLPMALIEAMASGLPVIATEVSGTREVMVHNVTGLLVPAGDVQKLQEAMILFLANPERAKVMGESGRKRVEEFFSAEKQAKAHVDLYRQAWAELRLKN